MLQYQLQLIEDVQICSMSLLFTSFESNPHRFVCVTEKTLHFFLQLNSLAAYQIFPSSNSRKATAKDSPDSTDSTFQYLTNNLYKTSSSEHPCNECSSHPLPFCLDKSPLGHSLLKRIRYHTTIIVPNDRCSLQTLVNYWLQTIQSPSIFKIL